jgi:hypothetical protein
MRKRTKKSRPTEKGVLFVMTVESVVAIVMAVMIANYGGRTWPAG